ncbi:MAG: M14 family zinc carboxypeptidase, partial [Saprospiraceae bacterium]
MIQSHLPYPSLRFIGGLTILLFALLSCEPAGTQPSAEPAPPLDTALISALDRAYPAFLDSTVSIQRFKLEDVLPVITQLPVPFKVDPDAARSVEDRPLTRITWGEGETSVLLWSQMHGNEPTATMALLDIFRFLAARSDGFDSLRTRLSQQLTLTFLPVINPDGTEIFERRNAQGIDLNRDFLRAAAPESRFLKSERERVGADWGFNLHDQSKYYGVGFPARRGAAISLLAPATDWEKTITPVRGDAVRLTGRLFRIMEYLDEGRAARYSDDFEPRAFGDNFQLAGTRTILIESGGLPNDPEKQTIRKYNFIMLISALAAIADGSYARMSLDDNEAIPLNSSGALHDVIVRQVEVPTPDGGSYPLDISFRQYESTLPAPNHREYTINGSITDVGDLSTSTGYREVDAAGLRPVPGKVYPNAVS